MAFINFFITSSAAEASAGKRGRLAAVLWSVGQQGTGVRVAGQKRWRKAQPRSGSRCAVPAHSPERSRSTALPAQSSHALHTHFVPVIGRSKLGCYLPSCFQRSIRITYFRGGLSFPQAQNTILWVCFADSSDHSEVLEVNNLNYGRQSAEIFH